MRCPASDIRLHGFNLVFETPGVRDVQTNKHCFIHIYITHKTHEYSTNFNDFVFGQLCFPKISILLLSHVCTRLSGRTIAVYGTAAVLTDFSVPLVLLLFFNRDLCDMTTVQTMFSLLSKVIYRTKLPLRILTKHRFWWQCRCFSLFHFYFIFPNLRGTLMFEDSKKHDILRIVLKPVEYQWFCGVHMLFCYLKLSFFASWSQGGKFLNQPQDIFFKRVVLTLMFRLQTLVQTFLLFSVHRLV